MKRFFLSLFLGLTGLSLSAQTTTNNRAAKADTTKSKGQFTMEMPADIRYQLPDGKIITPDKLDSAKKTWGDRHYGLKHTDGSNILQIVLFSDEDLKKAAESRQQQVSMMKQPAPDFTLKALTGETVTLSQFKGKIVVLNFWFTSCAPCREEMPALNKIKSEFESKGVVFIGLPLDDARRVSKFLAAVPFNYTQLPEAGKVHAAYKVTTCPASVVIDKSGIINFIQITGQDISSTLPSAIRALL